MLYYANYNVPPPFSALRLMAVYIFEKALFIYFFNSRHMLGDKRVKCYIVLFQLIL